MSDSLCYKHFKTSLTRSEHNLTKSSVVNFLLSRFTELVTFGKKRKERWIEQLVIVNKEDESFQDVKQYKTDIINYIKSVDLPYIEARYRTRLSGKNSPSEWNMSTTRGSFKPININVNVYCMLCRLWLL